MIGDWTWIYREATAIMPAMQPHRDKLPIRRQWLCAPLVAAAIAAWPGMWPGMVNAQEAAWRVECTGDGKILDCRAVQQLFQRIPNQGDRLLVAVLVRRPDTKTAQMTIQLPLGLNLTEAVQIKVDAGSSERQPIQTCTNVGCFVSMALNDKFAAAMRSGKQLIVVVQDPNKKPVEMSLPLLGFGLAFDKVKS